MSDLKTNLQDILQEKQDKIIPENIKKDVQIFDVTGTYEGSGSSGKGDVKLFETIEEMQADSTAQEGDLAIVYENKIQNMTANTQTQYITFPETVTLPEAFTGDAYCMLRTVDETVMFDGQVMLSQSMFDFEGYTNIGMIRVRYISSDGITYNRNEFMGDSGDLTNPVDLGTIVSVQYSEEWNDAFGYFMQANEAIFEGLYKYSGNEYTLADNQLTLSSSNELLPGKIAYGKNGVVTGDESIWDDIPLDVIQSKVKNPQTDIIKARAYSGTDVDYGQFYWKSPEDSHLELSPVIPIQSELLKQEFISASIEVSITGDMSDSAEFVGCYIGQTKQKQFFYLDEYFAVFDYVTGKWTVGKTPAGAGFEGQGKIIYTNNYVYYLVYTGSTGIYDIKRMNLNTGEINTVLLHKDATSTAYYYDPYMLSHDERYLYISYKYNSRGCVDFETNTYTPFDDLSGVYNTTMLLSIPNTNDAIELQVRNGTGYKQFNLVRLSPSGSVIKTYNVPEFAYDINTGVKQKKFVNYLNNKITVIISANEYQTFIMTYDVITDTIDEVANNEYVKDISKNVQDISDYISSEEFYCNTTEVLKAIVDFSAHTIVFENMNQEVYTYNLLGQVNNEIVKPKLLLEGYALLLQSTKNYGRTMTLLNFENKFTTFVNYDGTISPIEYDTALNTSEQILGEEETINE